MEEFKNLSNFGRKLQLKRRPIIEEKESTEEEIFIDCINSLTGCWNKSTKIYETFKLNMLEYEEDFYRVIEDLFFLKYGPWKTELILWFIFARVDSEGNIYPLLNQIKDSEEEEFEEVLLTTPKELWDFIIKLEEKRKTDK